ncbi:MAG: haloacid dehalogenase-like hydrolase, partial [Verrucomicrobia bacterium]|nr:haloacid dehalogenase-like hydrolase [Verrucomicrobiota bacterium]
LHTGEAGKIALCRAMDKLHGGKSDFQGIEIWGQTDKWIAEQLLGREGKPNGPEEITRFLDVYVECLAEELPRRDGGLHLGVLGILEEAHQRTELVQALLTGNIEIGARLKLTRYGVNHFFEFGAFSDDSSIRNELGPYARRRARERHGEEFPPERIFVIGDTRTMWPVRGRLGPGRSRWPRALSPNSSCGIVGRMRCLAI